MKIQLLYILDCPWCVKTKGLIRKGLKELGVVGEIEEVLIDTERKAKKYGFAGSPTVRIDGKDIQERVIRGRCLPCEKIARRAEKVTEFARQESRCGCRVYFHKGRRYPYPPKEMIKEAVKRYSLATNKRQPANRLSYKICPNTYKRC